MIQRAVPALRRLLVRTTDRPAVRRNLLFLWWLALAPVDVAASLTPRASATSKKRVLFVRTDGIGDFVLFLGAAEALRAKHPRERYEWTLVARGAVTRLAERSGLFDHVVAIDIPGLVLRPRYRYQVLCDLRRRGFDEAIYPVLARDFLWGDAIVAATGAARRVRVGDESQNLSAVSRRIANAWFTDHARVEAAISVLVTNRRIASALGATPDEIGRPRMPDSIEAVPSDKPYFVVFPGAQFEYRRWPAERFAEIANRVQAATGWRAIVCGGPDEVELARRTAASIHGDVEDRSGSLAIDALAGYLRGAELVISNDTGPAHLAGAAGTRTVVIVGGGQPGKFFPYLDEGELEPSGPRVATRPMPCFGCEWQCRFAVAPDAPKPCIAEISVEDVWAEVLSLLDDSNDE